MYQNFSSENYHFYSHEKLQYIIWACLHNVFLNFWTLNICCCLTENQAKKFYLTLIILKDADRVENSEDHIQTVPVGKVVSLLCTVAQTCQFKNMDLIPTTCVLKLSEVLENLLFRVWHTKIVTNYPMAKNNRFITLRIRKLMK